MSPRRFKRGIQRSLSCSPSCRTVKTLRECARSVRMNSSDLRKLFGTTAGWTSCRRRRGKSDLPHAAHVPRAQNGEKIAVKRMPNRSGSASESASESARAPERERERERERARWVREGPAEFNEQCARREVGTQGRHVAALCDRYPTASERPWVDIGLVRRALLDRQRMLTLAFLPVCLSSVAGAQCASI